MAVLSSWANSVITAIIVSTLLELILPNGKNKKYISTIIGLFVLFTIISPIFNNKSISIKSIFDIDKYPELKNTYAPSYTEFEDINNENIEKTYVENIKSDVKSKLYKRGYNLKNIQLEVEVNNEQNYGSIKYMKLYVSKIEEENKVKSINTIETININISEDSISKNEIEMYKLTIEEIKDIKEYLMSFYDIEFKNIMINE